MKSLTGVLEAAAQVEAFCRGRGWQFCLIGGVAVQRWGNPRFTQDVDVTLLTGLGQEEQFIDTLLLQFPGRFADARQFAVENRVLLARSPLGVDLDIALGAFPFEESAIRRASLWQVKDEIGLTTCSSEDLVVLKVFAGRDRDWADVQGILARQRGRVDLAYIRRELPPLLELKNDDQSMSKFNTMIASL